MSKPRIFEITFDSAIASNVYLPGTFVTGRVMLGLDEPLPMRCLRLVFDGRAHVEWTDSHSGKCGTISDLSKSWPKCLHFYAGRDVNGNDSTKHDTYKDEQVFFEKQIILWGDSPIKKHSPLQVMSAGEHVFAFKFPIPSTNLPGNFKAFYGYITYSVKAHIVRSTLHSDYKTEKPFAVFQVYDLNLDPRAPCPQEVQKTKALGCWYCATGRIACDFRVPRTGYVEGETVRPQVDIHNYSLVTVRKVRRASLWDALSNKFLLQVSMKLVQKVIFKVNPGAGEQCKSVVRTLVEVAKRDPIRRRQTQRWENATLKIPAESIAQPTVGANMCRIIEIAYFVVCEIVPRGFTRRFSAEIPVIIGSVPLRNQPASPA